jgi:flagellar FliL protein
MADAVKEAEKPAVEEKKRSVHLSGAGANLTGIVTKAAVIAAVGLVAVLLAFIVTTKVLKPMLAHQDPAPAQAEEQAAKTEEKAEEGGHGEGEGGGDFLYEIEQVIVNPASTVGSRFLSCSVAFEMGSHEDVRAFESKEVKIRDALITILSARTVDELADARLREPLRRQILSRVNKLTEPVAAKAVYFKDFVLQ